MRAENGPFCTVQRHIEPSDKACQPTVMPQGGLGCLGYAACGRGVTEVKSKWPYSAVIGGVGIFLLITAAARMSGGSGLVEVLPTTDFVKKFIPVHERKGIEVKMLDDAMKTRQGLRIEEDESSVVVAAPGTLKNLEEAKRLSLFTILVPSYLPPGSIFEGVLVDSHAPPQEPAQEIVLLYSKGKAAIQISQRWFRQAEIVLPAEAVNTSVRGHPAIARRLSLRPSRREWQQISWAEPTSLGVLDIVVGGGIPLDELLLVARSLQAQ